jgi:hypothetical protein
MIRKVTKITTSEPRKRKLFPSMWKRTDWKPWFAWYPVKDLQGNYLWLKKVYKRYCYRRINSNLDYYEYQLNNEEVTK